MFTTKKNNKGQKRKLWTALACLALALVLWQGSTLSLYAQGTAKVVAGSGKIREKATTDSETLASVKKGDKLDVTASTTDSQGYTWYKVFVDGNSQGYIRADLVDVEGTIPEEKKSAETTSNTTTVGSGNSTQNEVDAVIAGEESEAAPEPSNVATAKVKEDVRVRKFAGTAFDVAANAKANTEVTVSGEKLGEDGKLWYKVSYNEGDKTINGYIREDFLEVLEYVPEEQPVVEEEAPVEEEPAVEENNDYYLKYMENGEGEMDWYLFDNVEGTSQSLTQVLAVIDQIREKGLQENGQLKLFKILLVVAIVLILGLVVAVTILAFKLRDAYYDDEDYDDEEEEEDDEEEEEELPVERPTFRGRKAQAPAPEPKRTVTERPAAPVKTKAPRVEEPVKPETGEGWQPKDFLEVDDDMEFEFLDL